MEWSEGLFTELATLEKRIAKGEPLAAYLEILNGKYTINNGSANQSEKIALIKHALAKYPNGNVQDQAALLALKQELGQQLQA